MSPFPYMTEAWFAVLRESCKRLSQRRVADLIGLTGGAISQVLNGTGAYGNGRASTARIAARVMDRQPQLEAAQPSQRPGRLMRATNNRHPYMLEDWYWLFRNACKTLSQDAVALRLGVSKGTVSRVLRGTDVYGSGEADTTAFAKKVMAHLGTLTCPYLSEMFGEDRRITLRDCRLMAHRPIPTTSPGAAAHWKACRTCPNLAATAPPPTTPAAKRPPRSAAPPPERPMDSHPPTPTTGETP